MSILLENTDLKTTFANFKELQKLVSLTDEKCPFIYGLEEELHAESLYSSGEVWIFAITVDSFRACLIDEYEHRLVQKGLYFRKMECFNVLDNEQLKIFVERIPFIELKKD